MNITHPEICLIIYLPSMNLLFADFLGFFPQENLKSLFYINAVGKMSILVIEDFKGIKRSDIDLLKSSYFNMSFLFEGNGKSFDWVKIDLGCMPAKKYTDTKFPAIQTYPFIAF